MAESLVEAFSDGPGRVLLPQAAGARPVLADGLAARGWDVEVVEAYRTVAATPTAEALTRAASADAITFTSASTVHGYLDVAPPGSSPPVVVTIGPVTSAAARAAGLDVTIEAAPHTVDGVVAALVRALATTRP